MKRLYISIILALILAITSCAAGKTPDNSSNNVKTHTETDAYSWYCKKTIDHSQPPLDSYLVLPENTNAYYLDKNHSDYSSDEKVIYLTFDAGYENGNVEKTLDVLKKENVQGAFFILENLIYRNPDLVKRMNTEGHLICNHTATHCDMSKITSKEDFACELEKLNTLCKDSLGFEVSKFYRPPEGRYSELNLKHATELGYTTVFWSFAYADWDNNCQMDQSKALDKILKGVHNGEILLLHPTSATNAAILGDLIKSLKAEGFRFGSLNELGK